jgi:hypothetical protein
MGASCALETITLASDGLVHWGISTDTSSVMTARIVDILDAKRRSIMYGGGTGVYVVVQFLSAQLQGGIVPTALAS